jgi:hypothetical protein
MKTYVTLLFTAEFFLEWDVLDKSYRENQHTHDIFNNFFPKNGAVRNVEKIW